ncbi:Uncharacterised protein [Serratia quinivorans]|uniref:GTPase-associated system all-helical protein GASH n=1 Tax=Serratia quinivorans TaxID=137545 RepID=UPI002176F751|nr:GTPase-associated system all-helical protein GASH [Serratia quinivorans]CAI1532261.1 Uncharacterised protein [Serratia quinivorans]CAI1725647.1 Uncharacterised protein [Serratia quinivorans]
MNYSLADFYKSEKITISPDEISLRESIISDLPKVMDKEVSYSLISSIYGGTILSDDKLVSLFKENDKSFSIVNNARELSVLSSFIVYKNHNTDVGLHLAYLTASLLGTIKPDSCPFLSDFLIKNLTISNLNIRQIKNIQSENINYPDNSFQGIALNSDAEDDSDAEEFELSDIGEVVKEQRHYFQKFATEINDVIFNLRNEINYLTEESNFFWWVMRSYSDSYDKTFSELNTAQVMLASAKELASITNSALGPASIEKIILRASSSAKLEKSLYSFKELIELCPSSFTPNEPQYQCITKRPLVFPILFALIKKDEIGSELIWVKKFDEKVANISSIDTEALTFSVSLYRELTLLKHFK